MIDDEGLIRPYAPTLVRFSRFLDSACIAASLWIACEVVGSSWSKMHDVLALLAIAIFWISSNHLVLYRSWRVSPLLVEVARIWMCWAFTTLVVVFVIYAFEPLPGHGRALLFAWFAIGVSTMSITRIVVRLALRSLRIRGRNFRRVAIAGSTALGQRIEHNITHTAWMGLRVIGFFDDRATANGRTSSAPSVKLSGNFSDLATMARAGEVDVVYIALPLRSELRIKVLLNRLRDTTASVYFVPDLSGFDLLSAHWDSLGQIPVVSLVDSPIYGINAVVKRTFDVALSLSILLVGAVPMIAIGVAVKLTSNGPAIYRQRRYGLDGRQFEIWKFRTMNVMETTEKFSQATRNDPRVTALGAFLRKTSLDELPQFINVLQGRMSIVGPRPHPVAMNERQRGMVSRYMWRYKVKPGITGWAQVNGYRGETNTLERIERRIKLDLEYINNWSLWMDVRILLLTFRAVLGGENAY